MTLRMAPSDHHRVDSLDFVGDIRPVTTEDLSHVDHHINPERAVLHCSSSFQDLDGCCAAPVGDALRWHIRARRSLQTVS